MSSPYPHSFTHQPQVHFPVVHGGGAASAPAQPSRLDRLQQVQQIGSQGNDDMMRQLQTLYNIQHQQQFAPEELRGMQTQNDERAQMTGARAAELPEHLRGMGLENASREITNRYTPQENELKLQQGQQNLNESQQMGPEKLREAKAKNYAAEMENMWAPQDRMQKNDLAGATTERMRAETGVLEGSKSGEMTPEREAVFMEKFGKPYPGGIIDRQQKQATADKLYGDMKVQAMSPQGQTQDDYNKTTQDLGGETAEYFKSLHVPTTVPSGLNIPEQYRNDPKIQASLNSLAMQKQSHPEQTDPGLLAAQHEANFAAHPTNQIVQDLMPQNWTRDTFGPVSDMASGLERLRNSVPSWLRLGNAQ